jgi:hypothetical protein
VLSWIPNVNWPIVALATLAYYLLGALWFTPLFGRSWDRAVGFDRPRGHRFPARYYVTPLVSSLVVAVATAVLVEAVDVSTPADAAELGAVAGIGYAAAVSFNNAVAPNVPRPFLLGAITAGYHVVGVIVVAVTVSALG